VPALLKDQMVSATQLMGLAQDHRSQAERSASSKEQNELHRVADIYTALAMIDVPIEFLKHFWL